LDKGTDTALYNDNFYKKINDKIPEANNSISSLDLDSMKVGAGIFLIIIMSIMIAFSLIIIVIALTVIRFAIVTYIEGNMKNIGSMEALGYTGKELVTATILQFGLLAAVGIAIGLILSISCSGAVTNLASSTIGLVWNGNVNLIALLITIVLIMALVVVIAYLTAAKLKKITPIIAMREGINTHNFKKNHLPLNRSVFGINTTIGLKALLQNMKQNITVMIIVTLLSFVCVLAFTANYNFNIKGIRNSRIPSSYRIT
jgi:putative ABC transport system permease protein